MKLSTLVLLATLPASRSFVPTTTTTKATFGTTSTTRSSSIFDDFEEFPSEYNNNESNDADIYAALRKRQASVLDDSSDTETTRMSPLKQKIGDSDGNSKHITNWKEANCVSTVRLSLGDWVRRMAIDIYPLAVCGSASGNLYLADLQRGEELDCLVQLHAAQVDDNENPPDKIEEALECLYGQTDGGGVIAVAMKDDLIVSAGREGSVRVSAISGQEEEVYKGSRGGTSRQTKLTLVPQGTIRSLDGSETGSGDVLITALAFDDAGILWAGGFDGILRGYNYEEQDALGRPLMIRQQSLYEINCGSGIVSLSVNDEIGCGVVSTVEDGIILFSLEDGEILGKWNPFVKKVRKEFARSAIVVRNDKASTFGIEEKDVWSVIIGGSRGSMFQRRLNVDPTGSYVSESHPFLDQTKQGKGLFPVKMRPSHLGAVVNLASPAPGLFVSGAQDGSMRVWDCSTSSGNEDDDEDDDDEAQYDDIQLNDVRPQCLYALSGYKVWLGSIFADSRKLVSDGADNTIIVHSFDEDEEDVLFREEDEEDLEGFSFE